jgi:hypothetical protein
MVNLNLISKDKFQKMGFKNKVRGIAFIKTVLQTKVNKFNTIEQLTHHVKPKINNMTKVDIDINANKTQEYTTSSNNYSNSTQRKFRRTTYEDMEHNR